MGRRILVISSWFFQGMMQEGERHYVIEEGLPADARVIRVSSDYAFVRDSIAFMLESAEWPEISEDGHIPEIIVSVKTIEPDKALVKMPPMKFREFT
jgi:hypothetical protein